MKSFILANNGNTTNTYKYAENVLKKLNSLDYPCVVLGNLSGATYAERKADLQEKAVLFQIIDIGGLSYGELSEIQAYFETYGKRYGLLREFKENGIL